MGAFSWSTFLSWFGKEWATEINKIILACDPDSPAESQSLSVRKDLKTIYSDCMILYLRKLRHQINEVIEAFRIPRLWRTLGMTSPYPLMLWGRIMRLNVTQLVTAEQGLPWIPDLRPRTGDLSQVPGWIYGIWLVGEHPFFLHCGTCLVLVGEKEISFDKGIDRPSSLMSPSGWFPRVSVWILSLVFLLLTSQSYGGLLPWYGTAFSSVPGGREPVRGTQERDSKGVRQEVLPRERYWLLALGYGFLEDFNFAVKTGLEEFPLW